MSNYVVAPSINGTSIRENRTIGGNISFECSASGVPPPSVTWKKGKTQLTIGGRLTTSTSGLMITNITTGDAGDYTCVANNSAGTKELTSSLLSVHGMLTPYEIESLDIEIKSIEVLNIVQALLYYPSVIYPQKVILAPLRN